MDEMAYNLTLKFNLLHRCEKLYCILNLNGNLEQTWMTLKVNWYDRHSKFYLFFKLLIQLVGVFKDIVGSRYVILWFKRSNIESKRLD